MADDFPLIPTMRGGPAAPIESTTQGAPGGPQDGGIADTFQSAYYQSPTVTGLMRGKGFLSDSTHVSHDDAVASIKAQNLDPAFVPTDGMSHGALVAEAQRQSAIKLHELRIQRAGGASWTQRTVGGLAAGVIDPSSAVLGAGGLAAKLVLGAEGGVIAGIMRGGAVKRAVVGAAVGDVYAGGMQAAEAHLTGHDEDLNSWATLSNLTQGAILGGTLHMAAGPRALPMRVGDIDAHINMIRAGEATANASRRTGVPINEVTSSAGAVGEFQVTPGTAKLYGFDPAKLKDPAYNEQASRAILTDLDKKFKGDQEAIAVGYNAGEGWARKFVKAGHDRSILPTETKGYLDRIDKTYFGRAEFGTQKTAPYDYTQVHNPAETTDNARIALEQFANDERVAPEEVQASAFRAATHEDEVNDIFAQAYKAATPWEQRLAEYRQQQEGTSALRPEEQEQLARLNATPVEAPKAEPVVENEHSQYVKDVQAHFTDPEATDRFKEAMTEVNTAHEPETQLTHDEVTKAVDAAVKCGVLKGVQYGLE